jgi:hypothetical protein
MWKEAVVVECEVFSCHLHAVSGVTETTEHSGYHARGMRFDPLEIELNALRYCWIRSLFAYVNVFMLSLVRLWNCYVHTRAHAHAPIHIYIQGDPKVSVYVTQCIRTVTTQLMV